MAYSVLHNTPANGSIQWSDMSIQYKGETYAIVNGHTNTRYTYWTPAYPYNLVVTNDFPTLGEDDCLVFVNKGGIAIVVPNSTVISGDIIVPGTILADALAANSVTSDKIAAGAVSAASLAANSVTAAAIAADAIGAGAIAADAITSDKIVADAITTDKIAAAAVSATEIASNAITADKIAANAVTAVKINAGAITAGKLAADAVEAGNIKAAAVTAGKIATNAIVAANITTDAITADKILAKAVTTAKINAGAVTANEIATGAITAGKIFAGAIKAADIDAGAITAAKVAADAIEAIHIKASAITTAKIAAGAVTATSIASNAVTSDKIISGAITTAKLTSDAVTADNIMANAITTAKIATGAVTANEIKAGTITTAQIATDAITAGNIVANAITTAKIATGAVTATEIAANAVTSDKIVANAITTAKIAAEAVTANEIKSNTIIAANIDTDAVDARIIKAGSIQTGHISAGAQLALMVSAQERIDLTVSSANLGGTNLIPNSDFADGWTGWVNYSAATLSISSYSLDGVKSAGYITCLALDTIAGAYIDLPYSSNAAQNMVYSGYVYLTSANKSLHASGSYASVYQYDADAVEIPDSRATVYLDDFDGTSGWKRFSKTCSVLATCKKIRLYIWVRSDGVSANSFRLSNLQFERGTIATPWSPCPKDPGSGVKTSYIDIAQDHVNISSGGSVNIAAGSTYNMRAGSGSKGVGTSNNGGTTPFLWAGNSSNPAAAPFRVMMDGKVFAANIQQVYSQSFWDMSDNDVAAEFWVYIPPAYTVDSVQFSTRVSPCRTFAKSAASGGGGTSGLKSQVSLGGNSVRSGGGSSTAQAHTHVTDLPSWYVPEHSHSTPSHSHGLNFGVTAAAASSISGIKTYIYINSSSSYGNYSPNPGTLEIGSFMVAGWNSLKAWTDKPARVDGFVMVKITAN